MRHHVLLPCLLLAAACAPGSAARRRANADPIAHVRVLASPEALGTARYRVLDTVEARVGQGANEFTTKTRLRMAAAERGANAIVLLDYVGAGRQARRRALAVRLEETAAEVRATCLHRRAGVEVAVRLAACEREVARDPLDAAAWRALAEARHARWDWRGERAALQRVVALDPGDARAWYALGRATRGKDEARWAAWRRAAALDSAYLQPRLALGADLAADRKRAAEALPWLDEALRLGGRGEVLYQRGRALLQLERWQEAHDAFLAAADSGGIQLTWALGGGAYALSRAGRHAEAVALWDRVLTVNPDWFDLMSREFHMIRDEKAAWQRSRKAIGR